MIAKISNKDNAVTLFEKLEDYISFYDISWRKRIKPANEESINKILNILQINRSQLKLPNVYLEYLKRMGNGDGDLVSYILHAKTDLDTLYSVYEGKEEDPFDTIVPNRYIFAFNTDVGVEYYISTTLDGNQNITSENDKRNGMKYFSESFEKLLFQSAYDIYERKNKSINSFLGLIGEI